MLLSTHWTVWLAQELQVIAVKGQVLSLAISLVLLEIAAYHPWPAGLCNSSLVATQLLVPCPELDMASVLRRMRRVVPQSYGWCRRC